jgi:predicted small metal-binding protein
VKPLLKYDPENIQEELKKEIREIEQKIQHHNEVTEKLKKLLQDTKDKLKKVENA